MKVKYELSEILIKYIDDENDEIDLNTQNEFENAYAVSLKKKNESNIML